MIGQTVLDLIPDGPLPTHGRARATDPSTSREATTIDRAGVWAAIVEAFTEHGPMTDDELAAALPEFLPASVKACRSRMSKHDTPVVEPTGERRQGLVTGSPQQVWRLTARPVETVAGP